MKPYYLDTFLSIANDCMHKHRRHRPTMGKVVKELEALEHQLALEDHIAIEDQIASEDQIGKQVMLWGSTSGGDPWSFMVNKHEKLMEITIDHHNWIHSISFTKKDLDGTLHSSQTYGASNGPSSRPISETVFQNPVFVGFRIRHRQESTVYGDAFRLCLFDYGGGCADGGNRRRHRNGVER
ncbi:hypothetical protein L1987_42843 [Smallanthus sonchifolius]|uniref:Uncharacterized protein n=1 Tax=Smallanthus sonchifolius TaxID=185202 RepID=A0ACB9GJW5_9ASTR|nr:hypothetical protein L1987_42843 [Smallanthus sonchifolius]